MNYQEFSKYQEKIIDQKGKFMMPLGWGWTYPIIKYSAMLLISFKTFTGLPWLSFIILCGISIRLIMLPLMIRQMVLIQRMAKVYIDYIDITEYTFIIVLYYEMQSSVL